MQSEIRRRCTPPAKYSTWNLGFSAVCFGTIVSYTDRSTNSVWTSILEVNDLCTGQRFAITNSFLPFPCRQLANQRNSSHDSTEHCCWFFTVTAVLGVILRMCKDDLNLGPANPRALSAWPSSLAALSERSSSAIF